MTRRFSIAIVLTAMLIAAPAAALASGEDAQADAKKPAEAAETKDEATKDEAAKKDEAKKELADAKFNTLEDLFALLATPTLTVADTSIESGKAPTDDAPIASGVQWTRVETTERSD